MMDTQCDAWANDWNAIIVSINYTKADVKPINYGVEEATDTISILQNTPTSIMLILKSFL